MAKITANNIAIEYEDFGHAQDPVIVLVMGLASQMVMWPQDLIDGLVASGFRVVTFDNRDIGLSHKFHDHRTLHPVLQIAGRFVGLNKLAPYTLHDMAKDTIGLLNALDIEQAHVVGASMGGMIGQLTAARAPERVRSLTAIMSNTGNPRLPRAKPEITRAMFFNRPTGTDRDTLIDASLGIWDLIGTPGDAENRKYLRERIAASFDRSYYPQGTRRQLAAIIATGDFRKHTRNITSPTLVIHGSIDPLAPKEGGEDIARNVPGAKLEIIDGMAHDLPAKFLPQITQHILDHVRASERGDAVMAAQ